MDLALGRVAMYKLLALGFAPPTPAGVARMAELIAGLEQHDHWGAAPLLAELGTLLDSWAAGDMQGDFHRLLGPAGPCRPHETAYSSSPFAQTRELADIAGFYKAFHLEFGEGQPHLPDFAGTQLEFMAMAAGKEAYARLEGWAEDADVCLGGQRSFMNDHLGRWLPVFCRSVIEKDHDGFYAALAALAAHFVAADTAWLGVVPELVNGVVRDHPADAEHITCQFAAKDELEGSQV